MSDVPADVRKDYLQAINPSRRAINPQPVAVSRPGKLEHQRWLAVAEVERIGGGKNRAWVKDSSEKFEGRTETETCAARDAYVHKFLNTAPRAAPCKREHAGSSSAADAVQHSREARPRRGAAPTVSFVEPQIHGGRLPSQGGAAGPGRGHINP